MKHKWPKEGEPGFQRLYNDRGENTKTERICQICGLIKVTMHPPMGRAWREWWKGSRRIYCDGTPPCERPRPSPVERQDCHPCTLAKSRPEGKSPSSSLLPSSPLSRKSTGRKP